MADQRDKFALQTVQAFQAGEVRGGGLVGGVLGVGVFVHCDEVIDPTRGVADRSRAPVQPRLAAVSADGTAVRLDGIHVALPQRLKDLKDSRELLWVKVSGDGRADHLLGLGTQQRRHAWIDVDDVHVGTDARDAKRGVRDDLIQEIGAAS